MFKIFFVCALFLVLCNVHGQETCEGIELDTVTNAVAAVKNLCPLQVFAADLGSCGVFTIQVMKGVLFLLRDSCKKLTEQLGS